jgi:hypothetical protein
MSSQQLHMRQLLVVRDMDAAIGEMPTVRRSEVRSAHLRNCAASGAAWLHGCVWAARISRAKKSGRFAAAAVMASISGYAI